MRFSAHISYIPPTSSLLPPTLKNGFHPNLLRFQSAFLVEV